MATFFAKDLQNLRSGRTIDEFLIKKYVKSRTYDKFLNTMLNKIQMFDKFKMSAQNFLQISNVLPILV